ncbi:response regulator transcription factor [Streptomyces aureocirculatus]|uniref:response regulator transcription factor n=1 Tax=Streptomyces aureocirculatus TaxID=67275 RepID=UPI0004C8B25A|nr:helix-turn-helix transcriptional regulator [Streptomyces aureocirculatus]
MNVPITLHCSTRPRENLNNPQRQLLGLVAGGHTNRAAARRLGVTEDAVRKRLTARYRELGARDRAHAVALALCTGLLAPTDITHAKGLQR